MAYAEKRDGKLTGRWISEVKGSGFKKRAHDTRAKAIGREEYIKATGEDLPGDDEASGRTFKTVADELRAAGGPDGTWAIGKDRSVIDRLTFLCGLRFGATPIEKVTYARCEELVLKDLAPRPGQAKGSKMSNATINRYLTAVSSVLTYAQQKEYIPYAPDLPWRKETKRKQATYSDTMMHAVIGVLKSQGHPVDAFCVELLNIGGMRVSELVGNRRKPPVRAEQIEDGFVSLDEPDEVKNGEVREVYIGEENASRLRVLIRENKLPTYQQLYIHLKKAVEKCGYDVKRVLHAIRHTRGTRTVAEEGDIQMAKELLGHRSIKTTEGYRHISKELRRERAKKLHPHLGKSTEASEVVPFAPPAAKTG